ncbi:hypothetical protein, partial [Pseudomonas viridiflava]|uniref:hypothetical protein n=1 Tax=Pseudomonas viridiflava TaxID=33069 RepID=UPI0013DFD31E
VSSLGALNLAANQLALSGSGSVAGGSRAELNIAGGANNYGRITSAGDLVFSGGAINNYGTLGAAQALALSSPSLLNSQGLLFSGSDLQISAST